MKEIAIFTSKFKPNLTTFFLKTKIHSFSNSLKVKRMNTLLNIPSGFDEIDINYNDITSITTLPKLHMNRIIFGILMVTLGLSVIPSNILIAALGVLFGALQIANCYTSYIQIRQENGKKTLIEIAPGDKKYVKSFIKILSDIMDKKYT